MTVKRSSALVGSGVALLLLAGAFASSAFGRTGQVGVEIVSVKALPVAAQLGSGSPLNPVSVCGGSPGCVSTGHSYLGNEVTATARLAFDVVVRNPGAVSATGVRVALTINRPASMGGPNVHTKTLSTIGDGRSVTLTFKNLGPIPFDSATTMAISVGGQRQVAYPVIFTLPS